MTHPVAVQPVLTVALEVMDKQLGVPTLWTAGIVLGALGLLAARWRRWAALPFVLALAVLGAAALSELRDPTVGTDILREAGRGYPWHLAASMSLGIALAVAGAIFPKREQPDG